MATVDDRIELARQALLEVTPASTIGAVVSTVDEGEGVVSILFANTMPGYPGWRWTVSVAQVGDDAPSVLEVELMPGDGSLVAPEWVPWSERLAEYRASQDEDGSSDDEDDDSDDDDDDDDDEDSDDEDSDDDDSDDDDEDSDEEDLDDDLGDDEFDGVDVEEAAEAVAESGDADTDDDDDDPDAGDADTDADDDGADERA